MIKVLEKAIKLMSVYTPAANSLSLDTIAKQTCISKSTVFRILKTLERNGFVRYTKRDETYRLGLRLLELGSVAYGSNPIRKYAAEVLDRLEQNLKHTILLGIMLEDDFVYIDKRESKSILRIPSHLGARRPVTDNVLGMTLLAFLEDRERKRLLDVHPEAKQIERTEIGERKLMSKLSRARMNGYYIDQGELIEGVVGIGVPIQSLAGKVTAALGVCLPEFRAKGPEIERTIQLLNKASALISTQIDGQDV